MYLQRSVLSGASLLTLLVVVQCAPTTRINVPASDPTPPSAMWLQADAPGLPLANVSLGSAPDTLDVVGTDTVHITASADDPDGGVKAIRIWTTVTRSRPGQTQGPSLAGVPAAQTTSSATVGQPADVNLRTSFDLPLSATLGAFDNLQVDVFADADNHFGGTSRTAVLTIRYHIRRLRLFVMPLRNEDGTRASPVTRAQFDTVVQRVNRVYSNTGIRFVVDSINGWGPRADSILNLDRAGMQARANAIADSLPGRILLLLRFGGGSTPTGNGNAYPPPGAGAKPANINDADQRYVALPNTFTPGNLLDLGSGSFVAHELGHYLGLYHTFPGWGEVPGPVFATTDTTKALVDAALRNYIANNGGTIDALDGDLLSDTPPDPGTTAFSRGNVNMCTTRTITVPASGGTPAFTFNPDVTNVMSYYQFWNCAAGGTLPPPQTFTLQQIRRMQQTLSHALRVHLLGP